MFYFILTAVFGCRTRLFVVAAACKHKYISKQQLTANNNKSNSSNFHQTNNIQIHDIYTYVANTQNYSKCVCVYIYICLCMCLSCRQKQSRANWQVRLRLRPRLVYLMWHGTKL